MSALERIEDADSLLECNSFQRVDEWEYFPESRFQSLSGRVSREGRKQFVRILPRPKHPQGIHLKFFENWRQALGVIAVWMRHHHAVDPRRLIVGLNVPGEFRRRAAEAAIYYMDTPLLTDLVSNRDRVPTLRSVDGQEIDFIEVRHLPLELSI